MSRGIYFLGNTPLLLKRIKKKKKKKPTLVFSLFAKQNITLYKIFSILPLSNMFEDFQITAMVRSRTTFSVGGRNKQWKSTENEICSLLREPHADFYILNIRGNLCNSRELLWRYMHLALPKRFCDLTMFK